VGSDLPAAEHRVQVAWAHFQARKNVLCCNKIGLDKRWQRLRQTVMVTALYGAGCWARSSTASNLLEVTERKPQLLMMGKRTQPGESDSEFWRKLHTKRNELCQTFGVLPIAAQIKTLVYSWAGHVCRLAADHPLKQVVEWRSRERLLSFPSRSWRSPDMQYTLSRPRHGRVPPHWDSEQAQTLGPFWKQLAQDRREWRLCTRSIVVPLLDGIPPDRAHQKLNRHYSNRTWALIGKARVSVPCVLLWLTPTVEIAARVEGQRACTEDPWQRDAVRTLRWMQHCFLDVLRYARPRDSALLMVPGDGQSLVAARLLASTAGAVEESVQRVASSHFEGNAVSIGSAAHKKSAEDGDVASWAIAAVVTVLPTEIGATDVVAWATDVVKSASRQLAEFESCILAGNILASWTSCSELCSDSGVAH
jgi:hypothetical protein